MDFVATAGLLATALGVCGTYVQIRHQRRETRNNGRVTALVEIAGMLHRAIDHDERIIAGLKQKRENYAPLAHKINAETRPMLRDIEQQLVDCLVGYVSETKREALRKVLRLPDVNADTQAGQ